MDEVIYHVLNTSALFVLPALFLLFFYSFKSKFMIWLTIPASALSLTLCTWVYTLDYFSGVIDSDFFAINLIFTAVHALFVGIVTTLTAFIKSRQKKQPNLRIPATISVIIIVAVLVLASYNIFLILSTAKWDMQLIT